MQSAKKCEGIMGSIGEQKMLNKMMNLQHNEVHPEIMARAKQVLRQTNWLALKEDAPSAGQVFDWVCSQR